MKLIKKVFNYCVYRVAAVYKKMGMGDHIEQGYFLMFVSFTFYAMALTECLLSVFNMKISACMSTENTIFVTQNNQGGALHYNLKDYQGSLTATTKAFTKSGTDTHSLLFPC